MTPIVPEAGFLGLDYTTIVTGILVPFFIAVFAVWLTLNWRAKVRVKIVPKLNKKEFEQLSALYLGRVPDYERVPPNHFQAFFTRKHSAKSIRDFKRRIKLASTGPVHLLLIARISGTICGFLKAIYIPDIHCLFIAYLVTSQGDNPEERTAAQKLISNLFAACQDSAVQSIVCEICSDSKLGHKAKSRLFQHYASVYGTKFRHIMAKYQQPEICSFDAGSCKLTNAELHITYIGNPAQNAWHSIERNEYERLVSAIYKNVYLMSYVLAEPQLTTKYRDFLQRTERKLFASIRTNHIDLK